MDFGRRAEFGISVRSLIWSGPYGFANLCLWLKGEQVGDPEATVVLGVAAEFFQHFVSQATGRENAELFVLSSKDAIERVRVNTYPTDDEWRAGLANEDKERLYWPHLLCPGGGEPFDGEFLMVVTGGGQQRLLRTKTQGARHQDVTLAAGTCERVLADFVAWYEQLRSPDAD